MKIDQIAFYCETENSEEHVKKTFPGKEWIKDTVVSVNEIFPQYGRPYRCQAIGELQFNYDFGIELEILRYVEGSSWHNHLPTKIALRGSMLPFLSHVGIHMAEEDLFPDEPNMQEWFVTSPWRLVQRTRTISHSNPYLIEKKRTYEYRIYESVPGTYLKYIKRIEAK